jgi:pimeloyl-ACP methyl ester carboxylesterase
MNEPVTSEWFDQEISVCDGQMPVHIKPGSMPALVFLHYWGGSHRTFDLVIAALTSGNTMVTFDQRGWGQARDVPGPYDIQRLAEDVLAVVSGLALESYVLIGHSMGGKVAQLVASKQPKGLLGLVLVAPAPPRPNVGPETAERRSHVYDSRDTVSNAIDRALTHVSLRADLREQVITDSLAANRDATLAWPLKGLVDDITDAARQIVVPVHVLAGRHDHVDPPDTLTADLVPSIPHARIVIVEGTGHLSPLEAPEPLARHIDQFVNNLESST